MQFPMINSSSTMSPLWGLSKRSSENSQSIRKYLLSNPFQSNPENDEEFKLWNNVNWRIEYKAWTSSYLPPRIYIYIYIYIT